MSLNVDSVHYNAYYDHVLNRGTTGSVGIVYDIIADLSNRRGLRQQWEEIDGDVQDEIINKWITIIDYGK